MSKAEDEYFAREEALKLHKLHADKVKEMEAADMEERKKLHWMHCPKCGYDLETIKFRGVSIEKCFHCGVVVLDNGELELLAGKESDEGFIVSLHKLFTGKADD